MSKKQMKALTIKQPWADLIVSGIKDIENRTWRTNFRGKIYVHAAKTEAERTGDTYFGRFTSEQVHSVKDPLGLYFTYNYEAIIGEVDIIDCVRDHSSVWALPDHWHWVLANPVKYDHPILNVKGARSFLEFDPKTFGNSDGEILYKAQYEQ